MSKLNKKDVVHVAKLSNLSLSNAEIIKFKNQLDSVIQYIENLQEVDTSRIEPTSQTTGLKNVFREDEVDNSKTLSVDEAVSQGSNVTNNLFEVPMILTERSDK